MAISTSPASLFPKAGARNIELGRPFRLDDGPVLFSANQKEVPPWGMLCMSHSKIPYNINEVRGLACFLLVAYHVVGIPGAGMRVDDGSWWRYAVSSFEHIRMPLFTLLSGLVYAFRPATQDALGSFFLKKARRLLIPFVTVSTVFFIVQSMVPGTNRVAVPDNIYMIYFFEFAHFWYLQALCIIFLAVGLLDGFKVMDKPLRFIAVLAAAIVGCLTVSVPTNPFSINMALALFPYFLLGVAVTRFPALFRRPETLAVAAVGLAAGLVIHQMALFGHVEGPITRSHPAAILIGMTSALVLLRLMPSSVLFREVGRNSYTIYLYHAFFTAAGRMVSNRLGADELVVFLVSLSAGIIGPMVIEALIAPRPLTRVILAGKA